MHVSVGMYMYLHSVCTSLNYKQLQVVLVYSCVGSECTFAYSRYLSPIFAWVGAGPFLYEFAVHLKHSKLRKVTFKNCALTTVDVATLLAEGLSENKTLEQLHIYSHSTPEVSV